jgi:hypothetical protein
VQKSPYLDNEFLSRQIKAAFAGWPLAKFGSFVLWMIVQATYLTKLTEKTLTTVLQFSRMSPNLWWNCAKIPDNLAPQKVWPGLGFSRHGCGDAGPA